MAASLKLPEFLANSMNSSFEIFNLVPRTYRKLNEKPEKTSRLVISIEDQNIEIMY